jgi:competence protein ComGC
VSDDSGWSDRSSAGGSQRGDRAGSQLDAGSRSHLVAEGESPLEPGSAAEAGAIFSALSLGSPGGPRKRGRHVTIVLMAVVLVLMTVVLVVVAKSLESSVSSPSSSGGAATANLRDVLSTLQSYSADHGGSVAGLDSALLVQADPSLAFATVSASPDTMAVGAPELGAFLVTALDPSPAACYGILVITETLPLPVFSLDPPTARPGTYYFKAEPSQGKCLAATVALAGTSFVSTSSFPTEPV